MTSTSTATRPSVHAGHAHPATKAARATCRRAMRGTQGATFVAHRASGHFGWVRTMTAEPAVWLRVTSRSPKSISYTLGGKAQSITRPAHDAWFNSTTIKFS
jgi:hypothetical protein